MRKMTNDIQGYQLTMAGTGTPPRGGLISLKSLGETVKMGGKPGMNYQVDRDERLLRPCVHVPHARIIADHCVGSSLAGSRFYPLHVRLLSDAGFTTSEVIGFAVSTD